MRNISSAIKCSMNSLRQLPLINAREDQAHLGFQGSSHRAQNAIQINNDHGWTSCININDDARTNSIGPIVLQITRDPNRLHGGVPDNAHYRIE